MTIANVEMAKAWEEEAEEWTEFADRYDAAGARHWQRFLDAGLIAPTDHVLDVGCGTGQSTRDAARLAHAGYVLGTDISAGMLDFARHRSVAEGVKNVEYLHGDAQVHPFDAGAFDLAISRFGTMFFNDQQAAFANIGAALRAGGRLAFQSWQGLDKNEWLTVWRETLAAGRDLPVPPTGAPGPFAQADPGDVHRVLTAAGFEDVQVESVGEPMCFGADAEDAWPFVSAAGIVKGLTESLDPATRTKVLADLQQVLRDHETEDGVLLGAASWLITARRA